MSDLCLFENNTMKIYPILVSSCAETPVHIITQEPCQFDQILEAANFCCAENPALHALHCDPPPDGRGLTIFRFCYQSFRSVRAEQLLHKHLFCYVITFYFHLIINLVSHKSNRLKGQDHMDSVRF